MRLLTWFGAAILAMVMAESVAAGDERIRSPGIKGADDRAPVETDGYPRRAIGRVNNQLRASTHVNIGKKCHRRRSSYN